MLKVQYNQVNIPTGLSSSNIVNINLRRWKAKAQLKYYCVLMLNVKTYNLIKGTPLGLRQFLVAVTPLKIMKNAFYSMLKFFILLLKIFKFLSWHFGLVGKWLDKKVWVKFKTYDYTDWQIMTIHISPNISRSKAIRRWNLFSY